MTAHFGSGPSHLDLPPPGFGGVTDHFLIDRPPRVWSFSSRSTATWVGGVTDRSLIDRPPRGLVLFIIFIISIYRHLGGVTDRILFIVIYRHLAWVGSLIVRVYHHVMIYRHLAWVGSLIIRVSSSSSFDRPFRV